MKYYPKSQIQTGLTSKSGEFKLLGSKGVVSAKTLKNRIFGDFYIGKYFKTSDGKFFTGDNPNDPSGVFPLIPVKEMVIPEDVSLKTNKSPSEVQEIKTKKILNDNSITSHYVMDDTYGYLSKKSFYQDAPLPPKTFTPTLTEEDYNKGEIYRYFTQHKINKTISEISQEDYNDIKNKNPRLQYELYKVMQIKWIITYLKGDIESFNRNQVKIAEGLGFNNLGLFLKHNYSKVSF